MTRPDNSRTRFYPRDLPEEPGHYAYRVQLDQGGPHKVTAKFGKFESTREFVVGAAAGEFADLSVDRPGMTRLAKAAGGEVINSVPGWLAKADLQPGAAPGATRAGSVEQSAGAALVPGNAVYRLLHPQTSGAGVGSE